MLQGNRAATFTTSLQSFMESFSCVPTVWHITSYLLLYEVFYVPRYLCLTKLTMILIINGAIASD